MPVIEKTREETFAMETTIVRTPSKAYLMAKRLFDIIASSAALILLSPVFLILAFLVKRDDGGPVTYVCNRVGKKGKTIRIRKFRSMVLDADNLEKYLTQDQIEQYKREFKLDDDPRMTKIGKILRKTSLDELPQLLSILNGDMSIVGPRPIINEELAFYGNHVDEFLSVTPGLTGYWQVHGRNNATYESGQRQKLELYYVRNCSLWLDLTIIIQTVWVVLKGDGAK